MKRLPFVIAILILAILLGGCTQQTQVQSAIPKPQPTDVVPPPQPNTNIPTTVDVPAGHPSKIAFVRDLGGDLGWDIFTVKADGGDIVDITNSPSQDLWPSWSPDGTQIVFQSNREWHKYPSIYIMESNGDNVKCLTPEIVACQFPEWSPDGEMIIYSSSKYSNVGTIGLDLFSMSPEGASKMPIFQSTASYTGEPLGTIQRGVRIYAQICTSWFSDKAIVYTSNAVGGAWYIYKTTLSNLDTKLCYTCIKPDCTSRFPPNSLFVQIGTFPVSVVSPDGKSIAFDYRSPTGKENIYLLTFATEDVKCLTCESPGSSYFPTWSPDGSRIAFTLESDGNTDIYVMNSDGSNPTLLIENGMFPSWQK